MRSSAAGFLPRQTAWLSVRVHTEPSPCGSGGRSSEFPIDILKIDRSFVDRIDRPGAPHDLVRTIVGLGRVLQMGVVAEGVETESQRAALVSLGCGWAQGFYFARPMLIAEVHDRVVAASAARVPEAPPVGAGA